MRVGLSKRFAMLAAIAVVAVSPGIAGTITPSRTIGQGVVYPLAQRKVKTVKSSGTRSAPVRFGRHVIYGTIVAIHGTAFTICTRDGGCRGVDASRAIAAGAYSAPLFVGKIVSVDGDATGTTFTAAHIFRLTNLANLPNDK